MNLLKIAPLAATVLALSVAVPVMAAGHGSTHIPSQGTAQSAPPSHTVSLPSQANSHASAAVSGSASSHSAALPSSANSHASNHQHGASAQVLLDVQQLHALQAQVKTARQQYVAAVKAYLTTLSQAISSGSSSTMQQALAQLHTINTTLAQAVQTQMTAQKAQASTSPHSGATALNAVISKFKAELTALQNATAQVKTLTTSLSANTTSGTNSSSSPSSSTSPS